MPGRRPQPTALKILRGNPGQRRIRPEPRPTLLTTSDPPPGLHDQAREIWCRLAPELVRIGTLSVVDIPEFEKGCRLEALGLAGLAAAERKRKEPSYKALQMLRQASAIFARFGVGASDRTRIAPEVKAPASQWADLLATGTVKP